MASGSCQRIRRIGNGPWIKGAQGGVGAHGQDPLEQGPACAGRAVGSRTYPWIFLGTETLPPFPGLLQGRIRRSPAGPAAAPGSGPWHPAGDSQSGARGWEQEKSGFEERGRHRNLHQL